MVGSDGATHQGSYDLSFLRCIPNMVIMTPSDENECRQMLYTGTTLSSPSSFFPMMRSHFIASGAQFSCAR